MKLPEVNILRLMNVQDLTSLIPQPSKELNSIKVHRLRRNELSRINDVRLPPQNTVHSAIKSNPKPSIYRKHKRTNRGRNKLQPLIKVEK